ncbi:cytochrome P450 [Streptomyces sp. NPDC015350]|uniref:cytochrome P450 n=1 Tax=Streptomyces sp. NPDC015350 TaxID=3364955 RepID=UPI0036FC7B4D
MTTSVIDLTDLDLFTGGDPHAVWKELRAEHPVYWNATAQGGFWALTRMEDVTAAYVAAAAFSSRQGTVLGGSYRREADSASGRMLIASDDPQHRLLRQQIHKAFLPELVERARHAVRGGVRAALDRFQNEGGGDFAREVAPELPAGLLAVMFGLGRTDALHLLSLTRSMIGFQDPAYRSSSAGATGLAATQVEIFDFITALVEERRRSPAEDLVTILLNATVNGRGLTEDEILYNCLNVAVGGNETTPFTAAAAVQTLIDWPDQAAVLNSEPDCLPTALDEIFRWTSTNAYVQRTATRDIDLHGRRIEAGDSVTLWNASANRDESQFADADRFDVRRAPNRHIAFGVGAHRCIGMGLAQMEVGLLLQEIATRRLRFEPDGPPRQLRSNFMLGPTHLPVQVRLP